MDVLGLQECADEQIGSSAFRASQLKKVSIGYEMVTNPSLIMLDEPTSGLDSIQALQIVNLLKNEAKRGVTVIASIHQPSAEAFLLFDRCILLSEGRMLYNGHHQQIQEYFTERGFKSKKYDNLADWLLRLATNTKKMNRNQSINRLAHDCIV